MGQIKLNVRTGKVGGKDRLITTKEQYSTITPEVLVARIAQSANIKDTDVVQSLHAIEDAILYFVLNGHHVNLGRLGIFGMAASIATVAQPQQCSIDLVKKLRIGYVPSTSIKQEIANIKLS